MGQKKLEGFRLNNPILVPCLWLNGEAEEAAAFYVETFGGGRLIGRALFPHLADNPVGMPPGSLMSVEFEVCGQRFTALNGGPRFVVNPSISFFVRVDSSAQAEHLFAALSRGGETLMPLGAYPWSACYGWTADRFGVSWQVMAAAGNSEPAIAPALMFCGVQFGNAMAAIENLCGIFPNSQVVEVERFAPDEDGAGAVKQARFILSGHGFMAMDSPFDHAFGFNEAISLQVLCDGQADVDRYWVELSEGGEPGQCGWLKDRFGVSWQVVPERWLQWLGSNADDAGRERVFAAMQGMSKLDGGVLERAFAGE